MRDAREDLLPPRVRISRETSRALLTRLASLHNAFFDEPVLELCSIGARYGMFAPRFHATDVGPRRHAWADGIIRGWDLFAQNADQDVLKAILAVHHDPELLAAPLGRFPSTLLHGDPKLENLGLGPQGLVAIDWGDLTGFGPPEIDLAWYAVKGTARTGCTPDEIFAEYQAASRRPPEEKALDLACIGSLAQMGFRFALSAFASGPDPKEVGAQQLRLWTDRARAALDRVGPL